MQFNTCKKSRFNPWRISQQPHNLKTLSPWPKHKAPYCTRSRTLTWATLKSYTQKSHREWAYPAEKWTCDNNSVPWACWTCITAVISTRCSSVTFWALISSGTFLKPSLWTRLRALIQKKAQSKLRESRTSITFSTPLNKYSQKWPLRLRSISTRLLFWKTWLTLWVKKSSTEMKRTSLKPTFSLSKDWTNACFTPKNISKPKNKISAKTKPETSSRPPLQTANQSLTKAKSSKETISNAYFTGRKFSLQARSTTLKTLRKSNLILWELS